ncbi:phage tail sheath subtilisin-like domain-containing protein [Falsiroseomonas sp.]|uniref:phage tail sheath subtilisin-like domain-containing protein n=1 Tax=Falsiroseomonas sp. TaxID=2870721 RepID=UPI00271D2A49|nr:phage tail sheath subtilisin-like domain-containing protein [Falsiroseomonas sp.]MDO9501390.1 phage tail sheath subtilisin-like domain-containing protein [Falsiroseomonas sp.]
MSDVSFTEFPTDWRVPGTRVEIRPSYANAGIAGYPARMLVLAPRPAAGTGALNVPHRISRADQAAALAGSGSIPDQMVRAIRRANPFSELWLILVADPTSGATAATGSLAFSGTPSANGTMGVYVGGRRYALNIATTDTPTAIATRLAALITADVAAQVTAIATTGTVAVTHKHLGALGNAVRLEVNRAAEEATPAGLTCAVTAMASGAGAADVATAIAAIPTLWFTCIASAFNDSTNLALLSTEMDRRYAANGKLDGRVYWSIQAAYGALITAGGAQNGRFLTCLPCYASSTPPWVWAATCAGVAQLALANDPARQLRGLALPGVIAPDAASQPIESEQDALLRKGMSTFEVTQDGGVVIQRLITMYQVTSLGVADTAWLDIMRPETLSRIRYDWRVYRDTVWPRHKLAPDGSQAANHADSILTPDRAKAAWAGKMRAWERQGWIVNVGADAANATFAIDPNNVNRLVQRAPLTVIGNLMQLDAAFEFQA